MARALNRLNPRMVATIKDRGYYADGGGLYLQVSAYGTKSWLFRFTLAGRAREMGLGAVHTVTLADARTEAERCRNLARNGKDPIETRKAERMQARAADAKIMTFKDCAEAYIAAHQAGWKNAKHASQWRNTLTTYAYPVFGNLMVAEVDTGLVQKALKPIWTTKPETASRVRGRIEKVLSWATAGGYRQGDNPARWNDHLKILLGSQGNAAKVEHHAALPYALVSGFMTSLRAREGVAARALEFTILTAARTSEAVAARWPEIDLDRATWTIPADRMKASKEHRVPLPAAAVAVLRGVLPLRNEALGDWVFPGGKIGKGLSTAGMSTVIDRMNTVPDGEPLPWIDPKRDSAAITVHGFRSTFRDWVAETTAYPQELAEACLAHTLKNKVQAAYQRGDLFEKRARLMQDWADFCAMPSAAKADNVHPMRRAAE